MKESAPNAVRLRNVPFNSTETEVREFLKPHVPVKLYWMSRGQALVFMSSPEEAYQVQKKYNLQLMENRLIHINLETREDLPPVSQNLLGHHSVLVRGLPWTVTRQAVVNFFAPLKVTKVLLHFSADGRPTGTADVCFQSAQDVEKAFDKNKHYIGQRYIDVLRARRY